MELKEVFEEKKMRSLLLIVNPVSGKKTVLKEMGNVLSSFNKGGFLPTVYFTKKRGDATNYAVQFADDYDLVCCAGGDGTLNEVVTGLMRTGSEKEISYIPCGSTNDFAISRGLSPHLVEETERIVSGEYHSLHDIGVFEEKYFTYAAAFGAFSRVSYATDQNLKNLFGHTAYVLSGIKDLSNIKSVHAIVNANGKELEDDYLFGAVSNSTSVGGTVSFPRDLVDTSDGLFEVILIKMPKSILDLNEIVRSLISQDYNSQCMTFFQTNELTVRTDVPYAWTLDGEPSPEISEVNIRVLQNAFRLRG